MILAKLKEYADTQMNLPPEMYAGTRIRWYVNLSISGTLENFTPINEDMQLVVADSSTFALQLESFTSIDEDIQLVVPYRDRTGRSIRPKLLADTGEYALGIPRKKNGSLEQVKLQHQAFIQLTEKCANWIAEEYADSTSNNEIQLIANFLKSLSLDPAILQSKLPVTFDGADTVTFRVGESIPAIESVPAQLFWAGYTANSAQGNVENSETSMMCLVTGNIGLVEKRLPGKINGIPRKSKGEPARKSFVSAQGSAFSSYALENSLTSPISRDAAERFTKALNQLLSIEDSRLYIGSVVYVFWTREKSIFNPRKPLQQPKAAEVKQMLISIFTGAEAHGQRPNAFYALALSGSGARVVVRNWLETTVPDAARNLERWFRAQNIVDEYGQTDDPLGMYRLAEALYRRSYKIRKFDASKEIPARVISHLVGIALQGGVISSEWLAQVARRCAVGTVMQNGAREHVTHAQAAFIKLALSTQPEWENHMDDLEKLTPAPNLERDDAIAYQCGCLLAELEAIQRAALGKVNASIVERYYGSASSTPAIAFAPLLKGARAHLGKLRNQKKGTWNALEQELETILKPFKQDTDDTPRFPKTLSIVQQGIFALGFYHRRAENRAQMIARRNQSTVTSQIPTGVKP